MLASLGFASDIGCREAHGTSGHARLERMTRIIAGAAGRVTLAVPKSGTRPTSDRVREALFSSLEARDALRDARVLDLYAGSGALGLEAASRGAASVVLVEKNAAAARISQANAALVAKMFGRGDAPRVDVRTSAVLAYLTVAAGPFDLVFSDPPYELTDTEVAADLTARSGARGLPPRTEALLDELLPAWRSGASAAG